MEMVFSKSTYGFYPVEDRETYEYSGTWPSDVVAVSLDEQLSIREAISRGEIVNQHEDGSWIFEKPIPNALEVAAEAEKKKSRFLAIAAEQIKILTEATNTDIVANPKASDSALLLQWQKYRQSIRSVDIDGEDINWPKQPSLA